MLNLDFETGIDIPLFTDRRVRNILNREGNFWVSPKDSVLKDIKQDENRVVACGVIEVDVERDFGIKFHPYFESSIEQFVKQLVHFQTFCTRSSLMQSLQRLTFGDITNIGNGRFEISARIESLNNVPVIISPELVVGRFYILGHAIHGSDLLEIAHNVSDDQTLEVVNGLIDNYGNYLADLESSDPTIQYTQIPVAFSLYVNKFFVHDAPVIDLREVALVTRKDRARLAEILGQRLVSREELQEIIDTVNDLYYYTAETDRVVTVPKGVLLYINMGNFEEFGTHLASPIIDQGFSNYVRLEARSRSSKQIIDRVEFTPYSV